MKRDLQAEFIDILKEIELIFEEIIDKDGLKKALKEYCDNKNICKMEMLHPRMDMLLEIQTNKNIRQILEKLDKFINDYLLIWESLDRRDYDNFLLSKLEMQKRKEKLEELDNMYILYCSQQKQHKNYLDCYKKVLRFIELKEEIENKILKSEEKELKLKEYEIYFEKLNEFLDINVVVLPDLVKSVNDEIVKLKSELYLKMNNEIG